MRDCECESQNLNCMIEQPHVSFKGPWSLLSKLRPFQHFEAVHASCPLIQVWRCAEATWTSPGGINRDREENCVLERGSGTRDSRNLCWILITIQVQYRIYLSVSSMMASLLCSCFQINENKRKMLMFFCNLCIASGM